MAPPRLYSSKDTRTSDRMTAGVAAQTGLGFLTGMPSEASPPVPLIWDSSVKRVKGVVLSQLLVCARLGDGSRAVRVRPAVVSPASLWSLGRSGPGWEVARQRANHSPRPDEGTRGTLGLPRLDGQFMGGVSAPFLGGPGGQRPPAPQSTRSAPRLTCI